MAWSEGGTRVLHARIARTLRIAEPLHSCWFQQCESLLSLAYVVLHACDWIFPLLLSVAVAFSLYKLKVSLKRAVASNVEEEAKKEEKEEEKEPTNDVDDPDEEEEPTNDAHGEDECKEVERVVEEYEVPPTRAPLRLKDLDKFSVPMQLEMEKDSECDKDWVACCGYDATLLRGSELDDAPRNEWTKANRPGWRMLITLPQLPGEDDISLVAVKEIDCEKTYEEAEARRMQYKADTKV